MPMPGSTIAGRRNPGGMLEVILAAAVVGLAVATFTPYAGSQAWWLDLFAHFRVHSAVAAVAVALFAIVVKRARWAVLAMMLVGANLLDIAPHVGDAGVGGAAAKPVASVGARLKVVAFNIHNRRFEYASVVRFLRRQAADLVFLSEVPEHRRQEFEPLRDIYPYWLIGRTSRFRGTEYPKAEHPMGLMVLSRRPWREAGSLEPADPVHPYGVRVSFDVGGLPLTIFGVHLSKPLYPGNARIQDLELRALAAAVASQRVAGRDNIVIFGDMNLTPYAARFRQFLVDTGMTRLVAGISPTWPTALGLLGIPIDHVLARGRVEGEFHTGPDTGSDHLPMIGTLMVGG